MMLKKSFNITLAALMALNMSPTTSIAAEPDGKVTYRDVPTDPDTPTLAEEALKGDGNTRVYIIDDNDRNYIRDYVGRDNRARRDRDKCPSDMREYRDQCVPLNNKKDDDKKSDNTTGQEKYRVGTTLPDDAKYEPIARDLAQHLKPAPDDYEYVRVDDDVLLINKNDKKVVDAVPVGEELQKTK